MEANSKYLDLVTLKIEYDTILSKVSPENVQEVKELLDKKHEIMKANGFLAGIKINSINKKIDKFIKSNSTQKEKQEWKTSFLFFYTKLFFAIY